MIYSLQKKVMIHCMVEMGMTHIISLLVMDVIQFMTNLVMIKLFLMIAFPKTIFPLTE